MMNYELKPKFKMTKDDNDQKKRSGDLIEGEDYYIDKKTGLLVFTAKYHLKRGYCCESGCKHCPYPKDNKP